MKIIVENNIKKLIPSNEENYLISKEDIEKPEEERYYFTFAYLPKAMNLKTCEELYLEVNNIEE